MDYHAFPVDVENPVCTTCGKSLPGDMAGPLTALSAPWAEKFGVRCPECEEIKRARQVRIKQHLGVWSGETAWSETSETIDETEPRDNLGRPWGR